MLFKSQGHFSVKPNTWIFSNVSITSYATNTHAHTNNDIKQKDKMKNECMKNSKKWKVDIFLSTYLNISLNAAFRHANNDTLIKSWLHHVLPKALSHCKFDTFIDLWTEWKNSTDLFKSNNSRPWMVYFNLFPAFYWKYFNLIHIHQLNPNLSPNT